jgi:hypothetical protein
MPEDVCSVSMVVVMRWPVVSIAEVPVGRPRLITREKTLADIYRLRAEGLSLRQIERKLRLAKSTVYDALHPERVRSLREAKLEAAAQSSSDRRAEGLAFWNSVMAKIPDEA